LMDTPPLSNVMPLPIKRDALGLGVFPRHLGWV